MSSSISQPKEIHLAATQGFCAGVASAIEVVELALKKFGSPLYVRHHIVHNTMVIMDLEAKGVVFIECLDEVPSGEVVIFSAHGTSPEQYGLAKQRGVRVIDATCPLVTKVHRAAMRFSERGVQTILIGHKGHQELIGTSGYVDQNLLFVVENIKDVDQLDIAQDRPVGYLTQTTLSVSDTKGIIEWLKQRFPHIQSASKSQICYATQNRQDAVLELARFCDVIIVCGSPHSSNSNRLKERAEQEGVQSYIIDMADELQAEWLTDKQCIGVTSGASVPKKIVDQTVSRIQSFYPETSLFEYENKETGINFPIPAL